jgi:multidrug efflux pump subunit AcrA (membrane-fusion protein)
MRVQLKCPENTQVISVAVADQAMVRAGDLLMLLDDSRGQKFLAALKERNDDLNARLADVSEDAIGKRRDKLQGAYDHFTDEVTKTDIYVAEMKDRYATMSTIDLGTYQQALETLLTAKENRLQSTVSLPQLDADADIARRYINRALELISSERDYANHKIARLSIKAPISGRVRLFVGEHTPVKRGFVLAEID